MIDRIYKIKWLEVLMLVLCSTLLHAEPQKNSQGVDKDLQQKIYKIYVAQMGGYYEKIQKASKTNKLAVDMLLDARLIQDKSREYSYLKAKLDHAPSPTVVTIENGLQFEGGGKPFKIETGKEYGKVLLDGEVVNVELNKSLIEVLEGQFGPNGKKTSASRFMLKLSTAEANPLLPALWQILKSTVAWQVGMAAAGGTILGGTGCIVAMHSKFDKDDYLKACKNGAEYFGVTTALGGGVSGTFIGTYLGFLNLPTEQMAYLEQKLQLLSKGAGALAVLAIAGHSVETLSKMNGVRIRCYGGNGAYDVSGLYLGATDKPLYSYEGDYFDFNGEKVRLDIKDLVEYLMKKDPSKNDSGNKKLEAKVDLARQILAEQRDISEQCKKKPYKSFDWHFSAANSVEKKADKKAQ